MFNFSDIWIALFGATAKEAHEKEMREREERIDQTLAEFDSKMDEERQFYLHLDEEQEREKEQESRNWYNNEREQLEWEMRNADLYGYDKEDIQNRMDYLDEREEREDW